MIFTPNHCLHFDNAIILSSLPFVWRWRLSVAAAADDIFGNPFRALAVSVLGNAFPLAREGAVRRSLELMGARMDRNFNVLIYPEGKLTVGGPTQPFLAGAGLIAVEGGTPVVPMKLNIHQIAGSTPRASRGGAMWRSCSASRSGSTRIPTRRPRPVGSRRRSRRSEPDARPGRQDTSQRSGDG